MSAASGAKPQLEPTLVTVNVRTLEVTLEDFACECCGQYKICLTDRALWYVCVSCGYGFGIEPHPRKHLRRATDIVGREPVSQ
jgi:hypothetical protein